MNCEQVRDRLGPYVDGEVAADARRSLEDHLAGCATCSVELAALRRVSTLLQPTSTDGVPAALWEAIETRLNAQRPRRAAGLSILRSLRGALAAAAVLVAAIGLGMFGVQWGAQRAEAATVNFGVLLDALDFDPQQALSSFLSEHGAREVSVARAMHHGRELNFAIPETLPGGFRLVATYVMRFGHRPGVAARYDRDGELLAVIFHPPVLREDFGTHEDRACVVGKHRGHAVEVGAWSLVHATDATTCHCILSRLDRETGLPAIIAAVAPALPGAPAGPSPDHPDHH